MTYRLDRGHDSIERRIGNALPVRLGAIVADGLLDAAVTTAT